MPWVLILKGTSLDQGISGADDEEDEKGDRSGGEWRVMLDCWHGC